MQNGTKSETTKQPNTRHKTNASGKVGNELGEPKTNEQYKLIQRLAANNVPASPPGAG